MSQPEPSWVDDEWDDTPPAVDQVDEDLAEQRQPPAEGTVAPTTTRDDVRKAQERVAERQRAALAAEDAEADARDHLADLEGAVLVAAAKAEVYDHDPEKLDWQRIAALEDLAKAERARDRAAGRLDRAAAAHLDAQTALRAAQTHARQIAGGPPPAEPEEPETYFSDVDAWVREYLVRVYRRSVSGETGGERVWAAQWWRSAEAISRLQSLWRAWEALRLDPTLGMSAWWRDHADHHLRVLMDPMGPCEHLGKDEACTVRLGEPLPYEAPPPAVLEQLRGEDLTSDPAAVPPPAPAERETP